MSSSGSVIRQKMETVAQCVEKVASGLQSDPIYSVYMHFEVNSLVIDCTSTDVNSNLMMSFEIQKNGSGMGNTFTINIAYAPNMGDTFDINTIDAALETAVNADTSTAFSSRYCKLSYGYSCLNGQSIISDSYEGLVLDYECEIQDSMLLYTITGYSSIVMWNEAKTPLVITPAYSDGTIEPTRAVRQLVETYLSSKNDLVDNAYTIVFDTGVEGSDAPVKASALDKNVSQAIHNILESAIHASQVDAYENDAVDDDELITYEWFVSDIPSGEYKGTIYVVMNDPNDKNSLEADANLVFNWMSPNGEEAHSHIVLQFRPQFKGAVRLAKMAQMLNPKDAEGNYLASDQELATGSFFINDAGQLEQTASSCSPGTGGNRRVVASGSKMEKSSWVHEAQYPYKASMVTMGIPADIPVTGRIKVVPCIYGQVHHSAGVYEVLSLVDKIDSGGSFTTSWELIKMVKSKDVGTSVGLTQQQADAFNQGKGPVAHQEFVDAPSNYTDIQKTWAFPTSSNN